jgi:FkbM family methyltransferase
MSVSQIGQDIAVLAFYKQKTDGYFVEIGANNGLMLSNTYLLEHRYGWKGICAEAMPMLYGELVNNRPKSKCCGKAVYSSTGLILNFDIANASNLLSGLTDNIDFHKNVVSRNKTTIQVNTISLVDMLDQYEAPNFIDYLSLDTEGSEYEILKTFDFSKYTFGLIDVEHNWVEPRRSHIKNLLCSKGYVYKGENQFDDSYMHSSMLKQTVYYWKNYYDKPITVSIDPTGLVSVSSSYWDTKIGTLRGNDIVFKNNLLGKITEEGIVFSADNVWHNDKRKNILFIGANDMREIGKYTNFYNRGLFIEAVDYVFERLKNNLAIEKNCNYTAVNALITSKAEEIPFYIFDNNEQSSSIYKPNEDNWKWPDVKIKDEQIMISTTVDDILKKYSWESLVYDVILDVQGAELEVLKGFSNLQKIDTLTIEVSTVEFYNGGALYNEIDAYLTSNNFVLVRGLTSDHCDIIYKNKN